MLSLLTKLTFLNASGIRLDYVSESFLHLTNLTSLNLSNNQIKELQDDPITRLTGLQSLDISYNYLVRLPPDLSTLTGLQFFSLSGNRCFPLPHKIFFPLTQLKELHIKDNSIQELSFNQFFSLTALEKLSLSENPLLLYLPNQLLNLDHFRIQELDVGPALSAKYEIEAKYPYTPGSRTLSLLKDQPQYTLSVLINKTPEEVTLTCGCFGFSSFYMLQQEIITKLVEMGSIPSNHHFMILYHKGTEYVPLLQVQYLDISSKLRLVYQGQGQGSVLIHFDDTYRRDLALGQYERREVIGSGSYGIVWRGRDTKKKAVVAIKEQITNNYKSQLTWAKELQAHQDVSGAPRVPKLIAHQSVSGSHPLLIMEYVPGTTASDFFQGERTINSEPVAIKFLLPCLETLQEIHKRKIIHRDIKPTNIIIHYPTLEPWIVDFGIAKELEQAQGGPNTLIGSHAVGA